MSGHSSTLLGLLIPPETKRFSYRSPAAWCEKRAFAFFPHPHSQSPQPYSEALIFPQYDFKTFTNAYIHLAVKKVIGTSVATEAPVNGATKEEVKAADTAAEVADTAEKIDSKDEKTVWGDMCI